MISDVFPELSITLYLQFAHFQSSRFKSMVSMYQLISVLKFHFIHEYTRIISRLTMHHF